MHSSARADKLEHIVPGCAHRLAMTLLVAVAGLTAIGSARGGESASTDAGVTSLDAGAPPPDADAGGEAGTLPDLDASPDAEAPPPNMGAPPPGLGQKRHLRADDYARKNEGGYVTGLPLADYDPTTGIGFGARGYYYYDGKRSDPLFALAPYKHRVIVQVFATTRGAQDHLIDYDAPNFLGSLFRVRATAEYEAANIWPYYGIGSRTLAPLSFPGAPGMSFATLSGYQQALGQVQRNGSTYARYNSIGFQRPTLQLGLERLLLGGVVRPLVGVGLAYNRLTDFTGQSVDAVAYNGANVHASEATTLFAADCAAHRILGCGGGFDNVIRLALSFDTRDFEPDPNDGVYAELSSEIATKALGSQYEYARVMLSVRGFYSPIPKIADLVIAVRGLYEVQSAGTPFFSQVWLPFIDDNHEGLGGLRTLRGYDQDRFVGPIIVLTNYELRWTFTRFRFLGQGFGLMVVPFLDMGRVFDDVQQTSFADWKRAQGAGFRIAWNEATILMADYGVSSEGSGLYLNFNHIF
jgi:hypothetical protein